MDIKQLFSETKGKIKKYSPILKKYSPYIIVVILIFVLYFVSEMMNKQNRVYHQKESVSFEGGRVIGNNKEIYAMKEMVISRRMSNLETAVKAISESLQKLNERISEPQNQVQSEMTPTKEESKSSNNDPQPQPVQDDITFTDSPSNLQVSGATSYIENNYNPSASTKRRAFSKKSSAGPAVISFPVQSTASAKEMTVKIPAGSYLKAKLLTGVEASESRPVPVLLQADFFFIGPNKSKIDLSGCFIIAKSQGNLSIERVEMQANKISCVSKSGKMFERELNGFVADGKDSSFGVTGLVNSKQSRVASMAFLSSVVQGIGSAIQQAQTSTQTNALGGSSSAITGDQAKYMAAGGVSNAASLVTNWYLQHAQNLLPTINIGSGQDVWLIVQDSVELPNWYFSRPKSSKSFSSFSYLSRLID